MNLKVITRKGKYMINTEQSINGWCIPTDPYDNREYRYKKKNFDRVYGFRVYLCPICLRVYEDAWNYGTGNQLMYYEDFPTFKLRRIQCTTCEKS